MRINIWIILATLLCSRSWPSLDTCKRGDIRSISVPMTRPPRRANGDRRASRIGASILA